MRSGRYKVRYRVTVKFAGARRILFLVDRANLGRQTLKEFQGFTTPDDGRKFTELYAPIGAPMLGRIAGVRDRATVSLRARRCCSRLRYRSFAPSFAGWR